MHLNTRRDHRGQPSHAVRGGRAQSTSASASSPSLSQPTALHHAPAVPRPAPALTLALLVDRINNTNAAFRVASNNEERIAALSAYQRHVSSFSSLPAAEQCDTHYHIARTTRMIGECYMSLQRWEEAKTSLLAADRHCEDAVRSLPAAAFADAAFAYDVLMQQQQIHHLLADTHVALSEEAADAKASCDFASAAETFASEAEKEAEALLKRSSSAEDGEVKEALLSARINLGIVLIRLRDLAASPAAIALLPDRFHSAASCSKQALRHLTRAVKDAASFTLHQYQHLAWWHQHRLHVKDGVLPEALRCIRQALDVFDRVQADGRSREVEWAAAAWQRERADTRCTGAELIMTMVEEARDRDDEDLPWQERKKELRTGREWLRAVKQTLKEGEVQLSDEEQRRLGALWEKMDRLQAMHRESSQAVQETPKAAEAVDRGRPRKRRQIEG